MSPLLSLKNVFASYGSMPALRDVSIEVYPGDLRVILGANGAGKSTVIKTILGIIKPTSGQINFEGIDLIRKRPHERFNLGITWVPEGRQLWTTLTVLENLTIAAEQKLRGHELYARLSSIFDQFPLLAQRRNQIAGLMSGGEQQMVALARALMIEPKLILMDEPSLGLAPLIVLEIFNLVKSISLSGTSVLMVEQNAKQSLRMSNWAYLLETGAVVDNAPALEMMNNEKVKKVFLGEHGATNRRGGVA